MSDDASSPLRVVIVDDQPLVSAGLSMLLRNHTHIEVVGEGHDGVEAVELVRALAPDVVVMDVRMPRLDGVEATRRIVDDGVGRSDGETTRVLVLTTYEADDDVEAALQAGASGFLLKDAAPGDLVAAIEKVGAGEAWLDPRVASYVIEAFKACTPRAAVVRGELLDRLTRREREVLQLVARGLSNQHIMARLYVSEATVKTHVSRLFMKLDIQSRSQLVSYAYEAGVAVPGDPLPDAPTGT